VPSVERPQQLSAMRGVLRDLSATLAGVEETQRKMFAVKGTAWSGDRYVKAVVGLRGHLLELELDPRIYRRPNSAALAASIVATVRAAVEQALARTQEILDESLPGDLRTARVGTVDVRELLRRHDADLGREEDGDGRVV
jgi:DNA-binding protein YbaB